MKLYASDHLHPPTAVVSLRPQHLNPLHSLLLGIWFSPCDRRLTLLVLEAESLLLPRNNERRQPVLPPAEQVMVEANFPSYISLVA